MHDTMNTIRFRPIEPTDAEYILSLRTNPQYNQHLSPVPPELEGQQRYIQHYKDNEEGKSAWYFIIERLDGTLCGAVRLYNFNGDCFEWGSWILDENKTRYAAVESACLIYLIAFKDLGFAKSEYEVRKGNARVLDFHRRSGAEETGTDERNVYFRITKERALDFVRSMESLVFTS